MGWRDWIDAILIAWNLAVAVMMVPVSLGWATASVAGAGIVIFIRVTRTKE